MGLSALRRGSVLENGPSGRGVSGCGVLGSDRGISCRTDALGKSVLGLGPTALDGVFSVLVLLMALVGVA